MKSTRACATPRNGESASSNDVEGPPLRRDLVSGPADHAPMPSMDVIGTTPRSELVTNTSEARATSSAVSRRWITGMPASRS
jgi:hypothetical protein